MQAYIYTEYQQGNYETIKWNVTVHLVYDKQSGCVKKLYCDAMRIIYLLYVTAEQ